MLYLSLIPLLPILASATFQPGQEYLLSQRSPNDSSACTDQSSYTTSEVLAECGNATLFNTFRPKARFIAPEGWMNDPMGLFWRDDGSLHAGYQTTTRHLTGGNMSQGAAHSQDFTHWYDFQGSEGHRTLYPSQIQDIRAVFDGTIIPKGHLGFPTIIYTSVTFGALGAVAGEQEGTESQSLAWTEDGGESWKKLGWGPEKGGNPVIWTWPEQNLTGFRDPYVFQSPSLARLLSSSGNNFSYSPTHWFSSLSGGQVGLGPHLWLYSQREEGEFTRWNWLGRFFGVDELRASWGEWSGNFGINFETAFVARLNETGYAMDDGDDETAVDIIGMGTERGRDDHQMHWPLWAAVNYSLTPSGGLTSEILFAGVADWGSAYAFVSVPYTAGGASRHVMVGWTYEDDEDMVLAHQQGYQGAFTLFRDIRIKYTRNVSPSAQGLYEKGSWGVKNETDGSITVYTVGQKVVQETVDAYRQASRVTKLNDVELKAAGFMELDTQPSGRFYRVSANYTFANNATGQFGMRVLASTDEYTDILYDPIAEELTVVRNNSSILKSYGSATEMGKLRIWPIAGQDTKTLSLTVYVDNSVIEIYANDEFALTTRVYPWYTGSVGAGLLVPQTLGTPIRVQDLELWDGLVNAWPDRPANTSQGLVWDGPLTSVWGLYSGI